jgi:hypothetical protein
MSSRPWVTWLDLAVFASNEPSVRTSGTVKVKTVRITPEPCYVVSLNGKDVRSSDGSWTVFRDLDAVARFLGRLNISSYSLDGDVDGADAGLSSTCECVQLVRGALTVSTCQCASEPLRQCA